MFSLKESGKIMGITALVSAPFLLIFPPLAMLIWLWGSFALTWLFFVSIIRVGRGQPIEGSDFPATQGKLSPEEWLKMKKTQDNYKAEKKAHQREALVNNAKKASSAVAPLIAKLWKYTKIAFILLVSFFVLMLVYIVLTR
tara:strand:- start:79 stop:501 length:423 start_codon:yes stop_codon:yes gene_type:complete